MWYCIVCTGKILRFAELNFKQASFPPYDFFMCITKLFQEIVLTLSDSHKWLKSDLGKLSITVQLQQTVSHDCIQGKMYKYISSVLKRKKSEGKNQNLFTQNNNGVFWNIKVLNPDDTHHISCKTS